MTEDRLKALRKTHMMDSRNCTRISRSDKEYAYVFPFLNRPLPSDARNTHRALAERLEGLAGRLARLAERLRGRGDSIVAAW